MLRRTLVALALLGLGLAPLPVLAQGAPTLVFAAASLKNALDDIVALHVKDGGKPVSVSYAASSALAKQIQRMALEPGALEEAAERAASCGLPDATRDLADLVESLAAPPMMDVNRVGAPSRAAVAGSVAATRTGDK